MANEITAFIEKIPPVTKYYLGCVILFTFLVNYPLLPIVKFIVLDYDEALFSFQIWRFVTNFFIVGKFSMKFLFFCIMMYQSLIDLEKKAIEARKYSELAMLLFYLGIFLILINYFIQGKPFLSFELLFALIYIDSKRDPEKPVALWGIKMRSKILN